MFIVSGHGGEIVACLEVDTLDEAIKAVEEKWSTKCVKRTIYDKFKIDAETLEDYSPTEFEAPRPHWVCHFLGGGCSGDEPIDPEDYASFVLYALKVGWVD